MASVGGFGGFSTVPAQQWGPSARRVAMYDEYSRARDPGPIIAPFSITLLGSHRHLRAQFLYNTHTQAVVSTKAEKSSLNYILRMRFGSDAVGVLCAGRVFHDEEELIRSGLCPPEGARLPVLYDEQAPTYAGSHADARILQHEDGRLLTLPTEAGNHVPAMDAQNDGIKGIDGKTRTSRIEGFTYHESIPTLTRTIHLRFADGSTQQLLLTNKSVDQFDQVIHCLSLYAGDRWVGVKVGEKEYINDDLLFDAALQEGETYAVTYRPPSALSLVAKALDKKRNVLYTQLPE